MAYSLLDVTREGRKEGRESIFVCIFLYVPACPFHAWLFYFPVFLHRSVSVHEIQLMYL